LSTHHHRSRAGENLHISLFLEHAHNVANRTAFVDDQVRPHLADKALCRRARGFQKQIWPRARCSYGVGATAEVLDDCVPIPLPLRSCPVQHVVHSRLGNFLRLGCEDLITHCLEISGNYLQHAHDHCCCDRPPCTSQRRPGVERAKPQGRASKGKKDNRIRHIQNSPPIVGHPRGGLYSTKGIIKKR